MGSDKQVQEYSVKHLPGWQTVNESILREFSGCLANPDRQSHFFHGRYENLYVDTVRMPSMQALLQPAVRQAAEILGVAPSHLKYGYWFNLMHSGHITSMHSHDEDDELLSCVYYLDVPKNSGNLQLMLARGIHTITPENGMFVFFPPNLEHGVTENHSELPRLSVAINFGPA